MDNLQEFSNKFLEWTEQEIEAKKLDGFPVCPYARRARVQNKIQFIDSRDQETLISSLLSFDKEQYEIGIAWLGDQTDDYMSKVSDIIGDLSEKNPDLLYFTSTRTSGHFAKNISDCVFIQLKGDILEKRKHLHTTEYYNSWPLDYYQGIIDSN